ASWERSMVAIGSAALVVGASPLPRSTKNHEPKPRTTAPTPPSTSGMGLFGLFTSWSGERVDARAEPDAPFAGSPRDLCVALASPRAEVACALLLAPSRGIESVREAALPADAAATSTISPHFGLFVCVPREVEVEVERKE